MPEQVSPDEVRAAIQFYTTALVKASKGYNPASPEQARAAIRIALVGTIQLISALYPNELSFPRPLNQLLYDLDDLDHGKVSPLLHPLKVSNRPRTPLSEDLFRAIVAAAMTRLMDGTELGRDAASRDIAKRLSKMGAKHAAGQSITSGQIAKWREKMMTERAAESPAVARYELALQMVSGKEPVKAVMLMLDSLTDLSPANFPKKPPA